MSNQIVVGRHGKRWAVRVAPDVVPVSEFDTQAAAESAARVLADERGAEVVVDPGPDPQGLGDVEDSSAPPPGTDEPPADHLLGESPTGERPASGGELARETQQGL